MQVHKAAVGKPHRTAPTKPLSGASLPPAVAPSVARASPSTTCCSSARQGDALQAQQEQQQQQQQHQNPLAQWAHSAMAMAVTLSACASSPGPALAAEAQQQASAAPQQTPIEVYRIARVGALKPLESYVPMVLQTRDALQTAGAVSRARVAATCLASLGAHWRLSSSCRKCWCTLAAAIRGPRQGERPAEGGPVRRAAHLGPGAGRLRRHQRQGAHRLPARQQLLQGARIL